MIKTISTLAGIAALASAQRPSNTSICDYYTTALLKENNATNQQTLLTLVVNTAVIGNYTQPNVDIKVPGILAPARYNGAEVNLLPYFSGMLASTNTGGQEGVAINFLDGGAAAPLMMNMPSNNTHSAQYTLLTHLYEYFAGLLECSEYGNKVSPYSGHTSMYETHKYMGLGDAEVGYFISQVGLSAASFGVAQADVEAVGKALNAAFGYRCAPPAAIPASAPAQLQSICIQDDCPLSPNSTCSSYKPVVEPSAANGAMGANGTMSANSTGSGNGTTTGSGSGPSSTPPTSTGEGAFLTTSLSMLALAALSAAGFLL